MINLLDLNDFIKRESTGYYINTKMNVILANKLEQGLKNRELIYTNKLRGVGKTYELIQFAKKYNLIVVVMSGQNKQILKEKYNYSNIYRQEDRYIDNKDCIIDECVNIKALKNRGVNILTGFINKEEDLVNKFNLIDILNNEIQQLTKKIENTRENGNYGTYKNLIIALKDVVQLRNEEENKKNNPVINMTMNIKNEEDIRKTIDELENKLKNIKIGFEI